MALPPGIKKTILLLLIQHIFSSTNWMKIMLPTPPNLHQTKKVTEKPSLSEL